MGKNTLLQTQGNYSLPFLIYLHDKNKNYEMRFTNNNSDITFENKTYKAGTFSYEGNPAEYGFDGGGKLEITIHDNQVIDLIEYYTKIEFEVIGALNVDGTITKIKTSKHNYCNVTGDRSKVVIEFVKDDRPEMTFPTLIFSNLNNRGN